MVITTIICCNYSLIHGHQAKFYIIYTSVMLDAFKDLICSKLCWHNMLQDLRKPGFHAQLQIFINTEFDYLKYFNSGREADACMKFAMIL